MRNVLISIFMVAILLLGCETDSDVESSLESEYVKYEMDESESDISSISSKFAENGSEISSNSNLSKSNYEDVLVFDRKLIKEGRVSFETNDIITTRKSIFEAVENNSAYVSSDEVTKSYDKNKNIIVVRIPSDNFDDFLNQATMGIKEFDTKNIKVKDVTEEFVDVQARVNTEKALEQRYIKLLDKAKNIIEILEIEKKIGETRAGIESMEGRLKYLQDRVAYSTLTISFYKTVESTVPKGSSISERFGDGFSKGWENVVSVIIGLIYIWPFLFLGIIVVLSIKLLKKRKKR